MVYIPCPQWQDHRVVLQFKAAAATILTTNMLKNQTCELKKNQTWSAHNTHFPLRFSVPYSSTDDIITI